MVKPILIIAGVLCYVTCSLGLANPLIGALQTPEAIVNNNHFTTLNPEAYQQTVKDSRAKIQQLLQALATNYRQEPLNAQVAFLAQQLEDTPYSAIGAAGEGDWQPTSLTYKPGAIHVKQDPVYRLDGMECQTMVQVVMALLHAGNIDDFDRNFLQISYGAAGNPNNEYMHYYNRNNFIEGDFNPVNERNGKLLDVTTTKLSAEVKKQPATLTRQNWFLHMQQQLGDNVRVLDERNGTAMAERFMTVYANLHFPNFVTEKVITTYLPKQSLAIKQVDGTYQPNQSMLAKIPTPAVVEIIRDPSKWLIGNKTIKEIIGSELTVSHMGLLYRQTFVEGEIIYQDIKCHMGDAGKTCEVIPVHCKQHTCDEIMMAHATERHPNNYYWYAMENGNFVCSAAPPPSGPKTFCNRVESIPLFNYLTDYQYGSYRYMNNSGILGIHIEKLL